MQGFNVGAAFKIEAEPVSISKSLLSLLGDESALREAGRRGRKLVEHSFSWTVIVEQFVTLYRWLVRGGIKPGFVE